MKQLIENNGSDFEMTSDLMIAIKLDCNEVLPVPEG